MVITMNNADLWDVYNLVETYHRFGGNHCLHCHCEGEM